MCPGLVSYLGFNVLGGLSLLLVLLLTPGGGGGGEGVSEGSGFPLGFPQNPTLPSFNSI